MTESAILTEEQKKLRFRKMLQKREAMMNLQNGAVKEETKSPMNNENTYLQQMSVGLQSIEIFFSLPTTSSALPRESSTDDNLGP